MMMPMKTIYNQNILVDFKGRIAQKKRIEQYILQYVS